MELIKKSDEIISALNNTIKEYKQINNSENSLLFSRTISTDMYILASYYVSPYTIEEIRETHDIDDPALEAILDGEVAYNEEGDIINYLRFFADLYSATDELNNRDFWNTPPLIHKLSGLDIISDLMDIDKSLEEYEHKYGPIITTWQSKKDFQALKTAMKSYNTFIKNNINNPLLVINFPETHIFTGGETHLYEMVTRELSPNNLLETIFYNSDDRLKLR